MALDIAHILLISITTCCNVCILCLLEPTKTIFYYILSFSQISQLLTMATKKGFLKTAKTAFIFTSVSLTIQSYDTKISTLKTRVCAISTLTVKFVRHSEGRRKPLRNIMLVNVRWKLRTNYILRVQNSY